MRFRYLRKQWLKRGSSIAITTTAYNSPKWKRVNTLMVKEVL